MRAEEKPAVRSGQWPLRGAGEARSPDHDLHQARLGLVPAAPLLLLPRCREDPGGQARGRVPMETTCAGCAEATAGSRPRRGRTPCADRLSRTVPACEDALRLKLLQRLQAELLHFSTWRRAPAEVLARREDQLTLIVVGKQLDRLRHECDLLARQALAENGGGLQVPVNSEWIP